MSEGRGGYWNVRNYDEDGPQPPSELGDAAQPSISSEPPCPHCTNYGQNEPMEVQYVCERCGHRESVPDAAPPVEPEREGLTPKEAGHLYNGLVGRASVPRLTQDENVMLVAKLRRIAGRE